MAIYNENGEVVKQFFDKEDCLYNFPRLVQYKDKAKLIVSDGDNKVDIYSLPGTIPNNIQENVGKSTSMQPPFPNPSHSIVNLPYKLEQGQSSKMRIFNINGQLIETKNIDATFNVIKLNVESYKSGTYIYEYNGISNKFIVR
jgi:hypothetical protein